MPKLEDMYRITASARIIAYPCAFCGAPPIKYGKVYIIEHDEHCTSKHREAFGDDTEEKE